jgi:hypothetical protein
MVEALSAVSNETNSNKAAKVVVASHTYASPHN